MSPEISAQEKPQGERWLELLGYGHLKGQPTGYEVDGRPVPAEEFYLLCEEHAVPIFTELEHLDKNDPSYEQFIDVARKAFEGYFGSVEPSQ